MNEHSFSERLKDFRKRKGLTQQQLADLLGISNKSVSRWESEGGYPDVELLAPLARALGVTVDELLSETPVQRLSAFDWQNLLSFAFAVGGGVMYFLLDLFVPAILCYAIYLGFLGYGVYLQSRYTYRSNWFYCFHVLTNFFVNLSLLMKLPTFTAAHAVFKAGQLQSALFNAEQEGRWLSPMQQAYFGKNLLIVVLSYVLAAALTLLTLRILRKKLDSAAPKGFSDLLLSLFPPKKQKKTAGGAEPMTQKTDSSPTEAEKTPVED